ncbi:helix-turn-helix domain-containing protein [Halorientalis salina]|uniref:helix-turn-helix domain-containing protein n=1 Tax=Halorientalis salina TaxID=2932266 RepID=UPI0010ABD4DB|nr:helix-turn-helix domain-containing protein [Halorientalis salina]
MSKDDRAEELLELLGEERVRQILAATSREPLSAKELSEECDVAPSTIYRRVEDMVATDLLVEQTHIEADGSHHSVYEANVDHLDIDIEDGTIEIRKHVREDASQRFSRIWNDIRDT